MLIKLSNACGLGVVVMVVLVAGAIAWQFAFFVAPFAWTQEPARLARALGLQQGAQVADIGAGSGALAVAIAEIVGSTGQVYATELAPERLADIERRVTPAAAANVRAVAAGEVKTGLPDGCCDAVYMRAVFHHIADQSTFAANVTRALRSGGRLGVIDFAPGTLWFHGANHGVQPESVSSAFQETGLRLRERIDDWGGGMFLLVFERQADLGIASEQHLRDAHEVVKP
jgi:cyclopropane fatty-acyl-phospholipid synthase-like methyltransferase